MNNVVSLDQYRATKALKAFQESAGLQVLFGAQAPGLTCRHCGDELAHAMAMPSALEGYGCRECMIWFSDVD